MVTDWARLLEIANPLVLGYIYLKKKTNKKAKFLELTLFHKTIL